MSKKSKNKAPSVIRLRCSEIHLTAETADGTIVSDYVVPARFFILDSDSEKLLLNKSKELLNLAAYSVGIAYGKWRKR